ncbi:2-oxoglutarate dehydrogenase E1 component DHKTD1, mitochondrial-like [Oopsacas minuta]|uniref:2-oxoglutarate dehydrogenase E1 component DHKTD1, mitochondrial-like n=1 Tax=Oopsacas minuta TaxID=111878 RepID=A0AAV7JT83_9METZ|nr:2-oxoglutarate dehydrogenase E1 component DHKTD1, mitochondrial-like [Oopsacas minuta]
MLRVIQLLRTSLQHQNSITSINRFPILIQAKSQRYYQFKSGIYGYYPKPDLHDCSQILGNIPSIQEPNYFKLCQLIEAYRNFGHEKANLDAISLTNSNNKLPLNLKDFGLENCQKDIFNISDILPGFGSEKGSLAEIMEYLDKTYCSTLAIEVKQLYESDRAWLIQKFEQIQQLKFSESDKTNIRNVMLKAQSLDRFLGKKFSTVKRYSGEGAESMLVFMNQLISLSIRESSSLTNIVLGMPHRGRLNLQTGVLGYPLQALFRKLRGNPELIDNSGTATGDILSHLFQSIDLPIEGEGRKIHLSMLPNPSHLEAVNPVALGKTRAKQLFLKEAPYDVTGNCGSRLGDSVMCVLIHGDASFASQGVVAECLMMSSLPNFSVGGTVHVVVNNQLGYTTSAEFGRFTDKCTNFGNLANCPVIHVNGSDPESVVKACELAFQYRMEKRRDVIVDISCFRRWGHNELDEPAFTQPQMYQFINNRQTVPDQYSENLNFNSNSVGKDYESHLNSCLAESDAYDPPPSQFQAQWSAIQPATNNITQWDTGLPTELLRKIGIHSVKLPNTFTVHPRLMKSHVQSRLKEMETGEKLNWATAEALAIGSLLVQRHTVRLCGQDSGRGTFSQRHALLVDTQSEDVHIPLNNLSTEQAYFEIVNSPLIEESVLGFEYGMSIDNPTLLVIWEAQFGDFFNCAQLFIDTFISSGEAKWMLQSGLVLLLPHGYDGDGPEHSSCRIERFLQLCNTSPSIRDSDNVNMNVVFPTTPAQYYHLLRRQQVRNFRKPLIIVGPKGLLRLPEAVSSLNEMSSGTHFKTVLSDSNAGSAVENTQGILCSGKHYYALDQYRRENGIKDCVIIRVESLCPFPADNIIKEVMKFPSVKSWTWSQEEPENMGAWSYLSPRFKQQVGITPRYAGRPPLSAPAVGVKKWHTKQAAQILTDTFKF